MPADWFGIFCDCFSLKLENFDFDGLGRLPHGNLLSSIEYAVGIEAKVNGIPCLGPVGLGEDDSSISSFFKDMARSPCEFASALSASFIRHQKISSL
jgi:hypothetical protein